MILSEEDIRDIDYQIVELGILKGRHLLWMKPYLLHQIFIFLFGKTGNLMVSGFNNLKHCAVAAYPIPVIAARVGDYCLDKDLDISIMTKDRYESLRHKTSAGAEYADGSN